MEFLQICPGDIPRKRNRGNKEIALSMKRQPNLEVGQPNLEVENIAAIQDYASTANDYKIQTTNKKI